MTPDEILDKAADLYVTGQNKWIQQASTDEDGGICMGQALWVAAGQPYLPEESANSALVQARKFATDKLSTVDDPHDFVPAILNHCSPSTIPDWNDAPGRTETEVVEKLRSLAKEYREEQGAADD